MEEQLQGQIVVLNEQHQLQLTQLESEHQSQLVELQCQIELLRSQNMDLQCSQKTLLLTPIEIKPGALGFYQDSMFPMSDRRSTVDETKRLMDTYVAQTFYGDTEKKHCEWNRHNWRWRVVDGFFSGKVIDTMWEKMGPFKTWVHYICSVGIILARSKKN